MEEGVVTIQHLLNSTCDALQAHEIPRFALTRGRLPIFGIRAGGFRLETTIGGATFRFTTILYKQGTTHLVSFERHVHGEWTANCVETNDRSVVPALYRQFLGFIL